MAVLPYVTAPGNVTKALNGIADAATPDRVSQDFVKEILKVPGGSGDQMTSYLKKMGLANSDGTPTSLYKKFRNPDTRGIAAAEALKKGYSEIYKRNEYAHELADTKLKGLIIEITGLEHDSPTVSNTASCFKHFKTFANFHQEDVVPKVVEQAPKEEPNYSSQIPSQIQLPPTQQGVGLNLAYTINLNLPATSDIAVFNAIFKSLKENLLAPDNE